MMKKTKLTGPEILNQFHGDLLELRSVKRTGRKRIARILNVRYPKFEFTEWRVQQAIRTLEETNNELFNSSVEIEPIDDGTQPIAELINDRLKASARKLAAREKHSRKITLSAEPIGFFVMGDPHLDNEGCDWSTLVEHIKLIKASEGILAVNVGDVTDNWVGRLMAKYKDSSCRASDGWRLSEWLFSQFTWLAVCAGNHDQWATNTIDPLQLLCKSTKVLCYAPDEIRLNLSWKNRPDLEPIIWVLRHDFKGRSWFHSTHGPNKRAMMDNCHILTAGHLHSWGSLSTEQRHGRITHSIRVRGYKKSDSYAMAKDFVQQEYGESCLIVVDPLATGPGRITVFWDLVKGCDYLKMLRSKKK